MRFVGPLALILGWGLVIAFAAIYTGFGTEIMRDPSPF